jgi:hypothetical protein
MTVLRFRLAFKEVRSTDKEAGKQRKWQRKEKECRKHTKTRKERNEGRRKEGWKERRKKESNKDRQAVTLKVFSCVAARRTRGPDIPQAIASCLWPVSRPRNLIDKYRADTTSSDFVRAFDSYSAT